MLPDFLLPETVTRQNGTGPEIELGSHGGTQLLLTLGITRIIEQESLDIEVWGSADKLNWKDKPILRFPQKFYCGTYSQVLDLAKHPDVKFLRVNYKLNRWGRGEATPLFGFYVFGEEASRASSVASSLEAAVA
jgi:hypothetical protein